jgi:hypothetical protein
VTATKKQSRPAQLADEIEALGWTVERSKDGERRTLIGEHGDRKVKVVFERNEQGRDVFLRALAREGEPGTEPERLLSIVEVRAFVTKAPDVPFALDDDNATVLAAVAGREITWTNSMSCVAESAVVPRGGIHLKLEHVAARGVTERVLSFPSTSGGGFRSVRIDRIIKVS